MSKYWNRSGAGTADWLWSTLKNNSDGFLLLAAGCALLLRSGRSIERTEHDRSDAHKYSEHPESTADDIPRQSSAGDWAKETSRITENAREHAASLSKKMSETAADYAAAASEYARGTREKVVEQSRRLARKGHSNMQTLLQQQSLAVALVGLAAGAAVAAAFPVTTPERRVLGPARHRLSEAVESAGEKISEAGLSAAESLKDRVAERAVGTVPEPPAGEAAREIAGEQENFSVGARPASSSANKSGAEPLTSGSQREGEESSEEAKAAKAVLDAQQKAVDDIRAGRPAPYYFTAPQSSVLSGDAAPSPNDADAEKK